MDSDNAYLCEPDFSDGSDNAITRNNGILNSEIKNTVPTLKASPWKLICTANTEYCLHNNHLLQQPITYFVCGVHIILTVYRDYLLKQ